MSFAVLAILFAAGAAMLLGVLRTRHPGPGLLATTAAFGLCLLTGLASGVDAVRADAIGVVFGALAGLLAFLDVLAAASRPGTSRWAQPLALLELASLLLGFYADDILLLWLAAAGAVLARGLATPAASPLLPAFALVTALAGTVLAYAACVPALGPGLPAASFTAIYASAVPLDPDLLSLGFVFLLVGYGTLALLPSGGTALSKLLPALALLALLRFRHLAPGGGLGGDMLVLGGLVTLFLAAFRLRGAVPAPDAVAAGHAGIVAIAFGIGGAAASFAGVAQLLLATLGLAAWHHAPPARSWSRGAALAALSGAPPSFLFVSTFLVLGAAARQSLPLAVLLGLGIALFGGMLLRHARAAIPAPPIRHQQNVPAILALAQLGLGYLAAFAMPATLLSAVAAAAAALQ